MVKTRHGAKKVHLSSLKVTLECEWDDCMFQTMSMVVFMKHIETHFESFLPEGVTGENYTRHRLEGGEEECCLWNDCDYVSTLPILMIRHLYFHAYHTKVKDRGRALLEKLGIGECMLDKQNRNLIHEVISTLTCQWKDCEYYTDNMEAFIVHVEGHCEGRHCLWNDCSTTARDKYRLKAHMIVHTQEKKYGCPGCGSMFSCSTKFLDHLEKQVPLDEQNFQCSHCSKIFPNQRLLRDHVRRHVNHYKCPMCNMTCNAPANLRNHIKYRHSAARPWPCGYCPLMCRTKHDLARHHQTHMKDEPYWCDFENCTFKARSSVSMRKHYQREHLEMDTKRYCCHICESRYTSGGRLTSHLKRKHKFKWPTGFNRFRYKEHEDGLFRLQTVRYESLEITEQFLRQETVSTASQSEARGGEIYLETRFAEDSTDEGESEDSGMEFREITVNGGDVAMMEEVMSTASNDGFQVRLQDAGSLPA